eukprot:COSAG01_NODE_42732_length_437_cov_0.757396_1_plen_70_part_00
MRARLAEAAAAAAAPPRAMRCPAVHVLDRSSATPHTDTGGGGLLAEGTLAFLSAKQGSSLASARTELDN